LKEAFLWPYNAQLKTFDVEVDTNAG